MKWLAAFALVSLLAVGSYVAHAARGTDLKALEQATAEARDATLRFRALDRRARQARNAAEHARAEGAALAARIEAAEADLTAAERRLAILGVLQRRSQLRLAQRQQPLVRLTAALQTMTRRPAALALVQPGSVQDTVRVRTLLAATLPEIRRRTSALRADVEQSTQLSHRTRAARAALLSSRQTLQQRRIALARFEAAQRQRSQALGGLALAESDRAIALNEQARALSYLLGSQRYQQWAARSLAGLPGPLPRPDASAEEGDDRPRLSWRVPVQGRLITGVGEISEAGVHSRGLTFETAPAAAVVAPAGGLVRYAAPFRSYGHIVIIDHGEGWWTVATNLGSLNVAPGQQITAGSLLGRAGEAETRISVELRRNGQPVPVTETVTG